jgi:hypothetical protein
MQFKPNERNAVRQQQQLQQQHAFASSKLAGLHAMHGNFQLALLLLS